MISLLSPERPLLASSAGSSRTCTARYKGLRHPPRQTSLRGRWIARAGAGRPVRSGQGSSGRGGAGAGRGSGGGGDEGVYGDRWLGQGCSRAGAGGPVHAGWCPFPSGFPPAAFDFDFAAGLPACLRFAAVPDLGRAPLGVWVRSGTLWAALVARFCRPAAPPSGGTVAARVVTALCRWCAGGVRGFGPGGGCSCVLGRGGGVGCRSVLASCSSRSWFGLCRCRLGWAGRGKGGGVRGETPG